MAPATSVTHYGNTNLDGAHKLEAEEVLREAREKHTENMATFINGVLRYAAPKASAARLQFGDGEYSAAAAAAMQMAAEARRTPLPDPEDMVPIPLCRTLSRTVCMCGAAVAASLGGGGGTGGTGSGGLSCANSGRRSRVIWRDQGGHRGCGDCSDDGSDGEGHTLEKRLMRAKPGGGGDDGGGSAFAAAPAIAAIARLGANPADFMEELGLTRRQMGDEAVTAAAGPFAPQQHAQPHGSRGSGAATARSPSRAGSMSGAASQQAGGPAPHASSSGVHVVASALYESQSGGGGGGAGGTAQLSGLSAATAHRLSVSNAAGSVVVGNGNSFSGGAASVLGQRRVYIIKVVGSAWATKRPTTA